MKYPIILSGALVALGLSACQSLPTTSKPATPTTPSNPTSAILTPTATKTHTRSAVVTSHDVEVAVHAFVVRSVASGEKLEPVQANTVINKGDVIEYHGLFTNQSKDRIRQMTATLSIPNGMAFTGVTEPALGALASLDNQRFVYMPIRVNNNGVIENLAFDQYRALRWQIEDVGIGATAVVKYRATVQ